MNKKRSIFLIVSILLLVASATAKILLSNSLVATVLLVVSAIGMWVSLVWLLAVIIKKRRSKS